MIAPDARVLVINVARIGDTLLVTPALRAIKIACPQGWLGCVAHPARVSVLEHLPFIDELMGFTKRSAVWRGWGPKTWDYALVYGRDRALIRYAQRVAKRVVAFRQQPEVPGLDRTVEWPVHAMHAVQERLLLAAAIGVEATDYRLAYQVSPAERADIERRVIAHLPAGVSPLIGIQVASFPTKAYRDWPVEHFVELALTILEHYPGAHFLAFGSAADKAKAAQFCARISRATDLSGRLTLRQTAAAMQRLDLYVGVDTGPTHLAGALGLSMVVMYHCHHRGRYLAPLDHPNFLHVIEHPAPDAACDRLTRMDMISVSVVWDKVRDVLDRTLAAGEDAALRAQPVPSLAGQGGR
jgi:heptosyltransferase-3